MATAVHEHVHVIGFLIWLRLGCAVEFVAKRNRKTATNSTNFHEKRSPIPKHVTNKGIGS